VNGQPKIVIDRIKAMDESGKYIKWAKLEKVINYLTKENTRFPHDPQT